MRLFVGCELEDEVRVRLAEIARHAGPSLNGFRWVAPEAMHVTIKFLGEVEDSLVGEVKSVLEEPLADVPEFEVSLEGLGCFPSRGVPRVLWVGILQGAEDMIALDKIVESALEPVGFEREKRPFSPHITLARVKRGVRPRRIGDLMKESSAAAFGSQKVRYVSLIQSVLRPEGAVYTPVHKWTLKRN